MGDFSEHNTTKKILAIFDLLASGEKNEYSLSDISQGTDSAKSSILPILHTMAAHNYLSFNTASKKYSIGAKLFENGMQFLNSNDSSSIILQTMQKIVDECGEACNYAQLFDSNVVVLYRIESPAPIRMHTNTGRKVPIHCSALGKALISGKPDDEIEALLKDKMKRYTQNTVTRLSDFNVMMKKYRKDGFYYDNMEHSPDVCGIAVPLTDRGQIVAALSVPVPAYRFTKEKEAQIRQILTRVKNEIELLFEHIPSGHYE